MRGRIEFLIGGTLLPRRHTDKAETQLAPIYFTPIGDPQFVRQQDQTNSSLLSLGGGPRRANNYTLDGVSITDIRNRPVFIPNIESAQEARAQVSAYDAEMGRAGGGALNPTAKSGGNNWRGSGVFQNRPSFASSQLYFARQADAPKPDTYYYLYGGSFGAPIIKDRTSASESGRLFFQKP